MLEECNIKICFYVCISALRWLTTPQLEGNFKKIIHSYSYWYLLLHKQNVYELNLYLCIFILEVSNSPFYDIDIWFWNCSHSVVFWNCSHSVVFFVFILSFHSENCSKENLSLSVFFLYRFEIIHINSAEHVLHRVFLKQT